MHNPNVIIKHPHISFVSADVMFPTVIILATSFDPKSDIMYVFSFGGQ